MSQTEICVDGFAAMQHVGAACTPLTDPQLALSPGKHSTPFMLGAIPHLCCNLRHLTMDMSSADIWEALPNLTALRCLDCSRTKVHALPQIQPHVICPFRRSLERETCSSAPCMRASFCTNSSFSRKVHACKTNQHIISGTCSCMMLVDVVLSRVHPPPPPPPPPRGRKELLEIAIARKHAWADMFWHVIVCCRRFAKIRTRIAHCLQTDRRWTM